MAWLKRIGPDPFVCAVLFGVTFALSSYWIIENPQRPLPDPTLYEGIGANLAEGNGYSFDNKPPYRPELTRAPFLPLLIAGLYSVTGRNPQAVLFMNAVLIGLAVAVGYMVALKLFKDRRVATAGAIIAFLTPPVTGTANNILTEPVAMLQLTGLAWLLLDWPNRRETKWAPLYAAFIGILLATLVLNRSSMTPLALIAAAYVALTTVRNRVRKATAWITVGALCVTLGTPVLSWSARNASMNLAFSPAPIGLYASRVFDMKRYKDQLLEPGQRLPKVNRQYFLHWKKRYGPEKLQELEAKNRGWFENWSRENSGRIWKSMPHRFVGLFSFFRNSIYPPWPYHKDQEMRNVMRWISRSLWMLSLLGLIISFRNRQARWIWIGTVTPLIVVHMLTVCHSRYMFPLLPLLMPYGGVALVWSFDRFFGRWLPRRKVSKKETRK